MGVSLTSRLLDFEDFLIMEAWLDQHHKDHHKPGIEVHDWDKPAEEQHFKATVIFENNGLASYFKLTWC